MKRFNGNDRSGTKRKFNKFDNKGKGKRGPYRGPWWLRDTPTKDPAKVDEKRLLASFDHRTVRVRDGEDIERALRRFNKMVEMAGVLSELKKREYYLSPSEKVRDKKLKAQKRARKKLKRSPPPRRPSNQ